MYQFTVYDNSQDKMLVEKFTDDRQLILEWFNGYVVQYGGTDKTLKERDLAPYFPRICWNNSERSIFVEVLQIANRAYAYFGELPNSTLFHRHGDNFKKISHWQAINLTNNRETPFGYSDFTVVNDYSRLSEEYFN